MPLPNFPQMSLISNGILEFFGISLASRDLLFQPNKAGLLVFLEEIEKQFDQRWFMPNTP
jgi:hypothetical protein